MVHLHILDFLSSPFLYKLNIENVLDVTLHEENEEGDMGNPGSLQRLLRGLANQHAQQRDEFITAELTNHLFQSGCKYRPNSNMFQYFNNNYYLVIWRSLISNNHLYSFSIRT